MKITIELKNFNLKRLKDSYRMYYGMKPNEEVTRDQVREFLSSLVSADLDSIDNPGD